MLKTSENTLDPADWPAFRLQGHQMLDDMLDHLEHLREQPVWQPLPQDVRDTFRQPMDTAPADLASVHDAFMQTIMPYAVGNTHPGFMGWVHGGGTPVGMLADMLAAGLNANLGVAIKPLSNLNGNWFNGFDNYLLSRKRPVACL
jgi:aromatic-L-amino-acid decarboxylase